MEKKRSLKFLIVSACLALLLVSIGGIVAGANEPVAIDENLKLSGASLDLNDKISIAFAVKADAVGYETKDKPLDYALYLYDTNPGTAAGNGKQITDFVVKTIGDEQYVLFITDGFTAPQYKNTVYARIGNKSGTVFGDVQKTGVLELAYKQQAKFQAQLETATEDTKDSINTRVKLFTAIINYGINADLVVAGKTEFTHSYVTVSEGKIDDGNGGKWTGGVYKNGDKLNLVAEASDLKYYTLTGVDFYGWTDGTNISAGNQFTVAKSGVISHAYAQTKIDNNPTLTQLGLASSAPNNFNWNVITTALVQKNDPNAIYGKQLSNDSLGQNLTRTITLDENGVPVMTYIYNQKMFELDGQYTDGQARDELKKNHSNIFGKDGYGVQENEQWFRYNNPLVASSSSPYTMSFDIFFPGTDKNGNGEKYDAGVWVTEKLRVDENGEAATDDDGEDIYDIVTRNGDMFTHNTGPAMLRIPIAVANGANNVVKLMHVHLIGVIKGGKVTGFYVDTVGSGDPNNGAATAGFTSKVFDIEEKHTMQFQIIPDASTNTISAINIIIDGELLTTHLASNGEGKLGIENDAKSVVIAGTGKRTTIEYGIQSYGRFMGDVQISNIYATHDTVLTADQIKASALYNDTATNYTENAYVTAYTASGRTHHAWNTLSTLAGANKLGTYMSSKLNAANGSWYYDAATNSVVYAKKNISNVDASDAGLFTMLIDNPLHNKKWEAGTTVVFEYTMAFGAVDGDGDYTFSEWAEISGKNTMVGGFMILGYGDGNGAATVTPNTSAGLSKNMISNENSVFAGYRLNNGKEASNHTMGISYRAMNGDLGAKTVATQTYGGSAVTYRYELDIGNDGVPTTLRIYVNGGSMPVITRYNQSYIFTNDTTAQGMSDFSVNVLEVNNPTEKKPTKAQNTPNLTADFFAAPYIEISCYPDRYMECTMIFSNMRAWSEINK